MGLEMRVPEPCRWFLWCGLSAAVAVWVGLRLTWPLCLLAAAVALGVGLWLRRAPAVVVCVLTGLVFLGTACGFRAYYAHLTANRVGETDRVTGLVTEQVADSWYTLKLRESSLLPAGTRVLLYCPELAAPAPFDTVSAQIIYRAQGENADALLADRIVLRAVPTAYGENAVTVLPESRGGVGRLAYRVRSAVSERLLQLLPGQEGAVLTAMCLGDSRFLSVDTKALFRAGGISHILVVSGLHLTALVGGVYGFLRLLRLRCRPTALLTGAVLLAYCFLVGFSPSVLRAGVMALVLLAGRFVRRPADGLNSMGLALCGILLANPYALFDVGLQFSFSAAGGVLALTPRLTELTAPLFRRCRWVRPIFPGLCTTLGASLLLSPFLAAHFEELSLISPLVNLVAVPPAGLILLLGCGAGVLLLCPPLAWAGRGLSLLAGLLVRVLLLFCRWMEGWTESVSLLSWSAFAVWLNLTCAVLVVLLLKKRYSGVLRVSGLAAASLVLLLLLAPLWKGADYTVYVLSQGDAATVVVQQRERCLIYLQEADGAAGAKRLWSGLGGVRDTVIAVERGTTADAASLQALREETGAMLVLTGDASGWTEGLSGALTALGRGEERAVWDEMVLARTEEDWWRLRLGDTCLLLTPPAEHFRPQAISWETVDGLVFSGETVYNGFWLEVPWSVWVCKADGASMADALPKRPRVTVTDAPVIFVTHGRGDWRQRQ